MVFWRSMPEDLTLFLQIMICLTNASCRLAEGNEFNSFQDGTIEILERDNLKRAEFEESLISRQSRNETFQEVMQTSLQEFKQIPNQVTLLRDQIAAYLEPPTTMCVGDRATTFDTTLRGINPVLTLFLQSSVAQLHCQPRLQSNAQDAMLML